MTYNISLQKYYLLVLALCCLFSCEQEVLQHEEQSSVSQISFTKLDASKAGIDFSNNLNPDFNTRANLFKYEYFYNGAGVAVGDLDNDGLPDLVFTGNQVENKVYLNQDAFKFKDISVSSKLNLINRWSTGVTMADVNMDGYLDIYICNSGPGDNPSSRKNEFYINNGDLSFTESAELYGIADDNFSTQASFFDYDKDGDLDLIVMNHADWFTKPTGTSLLELKNNPELTTKVSQRLYRNNGDMTFTDVTKESGMLKYAFGLGLATSDINMDGYVDAYIANDFMVPDYLFLNKKNGTFKENIKNLTRQISWFGMGCDVVDINNDALPDIAVVDMTSSDHIRSKTLMPPMNPRDFWAGVNAFGFQYQYMFNSLQINNGNNTFSNIANLSGIHQTDWSWATLFADFDNDGDKDNFITNGYRKYNSDNDFLINYQQELKDSAGKLNAAQLKSLYSQMPEMKIPNLLYRNDGNLHFEEVASNWGLDDANYSNGAAYADLDGDGDLDIVVNNIDSPPFVYRNELDRGNNYLQIKLDDPNPLNAKVTLEYKNKKQYQELSPVRGYQSSMDHVLHFGLADNKIVEKLTIIWPTGETQTIMDVAANQRLVVKKKPGKPFAKEKKAKPLLKAQKMSIFSHKENKYNDFAKEVLLPHKQSSLGPFLSIGDVNGDGRDDLFVGGAKGQAGKLLLRQANTGFEESENQVWLADKNHEDLGSCFFDVDMDGDLDLYVVSGGNEEDAGHILLQDRLYLNDGNGGFTKGELPSLKSSGQTVKAIDFDGDKDMDLFISGRAIPGKYPYPDRSYLLENQEGVLKDVTAEKAADLLNPGILTDFEFVDFNSDEKLDLVIVGEWMPVMFFKNTGNGFSKVKEREDLKGWWYSIEKADLDDDGDLDLVLGNIGENNKFRAKAKKPLYINCNDFDGNGSFDIVLSKTYKEKLVPTRGRECSSEQMPFLKDKFPNYNSFANASLNDLYGQDKLSNGLQLEVNEMRSMILWNEDGKFSAEPLPVEAQVAPVNGIVIQDLNRDGKKDILIAGNMFNTEIETQRYDAGQGTIFLNLGNRKFLTKAAATSGFFAPGNVKDVKWISFGKNAGVLVANNDGPVQYFRMNW